MFYIYYFILATFLSYCLFAYYPKLAKKIGLIDEKNQHYANNPTPSGAGIIFLIIFLIGNIYFYFFDDLFLSSLPNRYYIFLVSISFLSIIAFKDDMNSIDPIMRLIIQFLFIYLALVSLKLNTINLPDKLVFLLAILIWIYIMNISNFIDGSDGFLITNFLFYLLSAIILGYYFELNFFSKNIAIICLPFCLTFFYFNKPVAKLFMGDAGSIFVGFLSGFLFLELIILDKYYLAVSLMAYKITDCSICLIKKLRKGIMPWIGIYDYYFLKPTLIKKINHYNVLFLQIIFHTLNLIIIILQEIFVLNYLFLLSIILSLILIFIYNNLENNLNFLKIFK